MNLYENIHFNHNCNLRHRTHNPSNYTRCHNDHYLQTPFPGMSLSIKIHSLVTHPFRIQRFQKSTLSSCFDLSMLSNHLLQLLYCCPLHPKIANYQHTLERNKKMELVDMTVIAEVRDFAIQTKNPANAWGGARDGRGQSRPRAQPESCRIRQFWLNSTRGQTPSVLGCATSLICNSFLIQIPSNSM